MKMPNFSRFYRLHLIGASSLNFFKLSLTGLLLSCLAPWSALAIPTNRGSQHGFAQFLSAVSQQPGGFVQFELKDTLQRLEATEDSITTDQGGNYLIVASPQVTATKDGGCVDAWLVLNEQDVKNSGVRLCQAKAGNTNVVVSQSIMSLKQGDKLQVKTSGKDVKLDAIKPQKGPLIPSIIFTVLQID